MNLWTALLYISARLEVSYAVAVRRLPRPGCSEDSLSPSSIPSFLEGEHRDRVLAEIDQDGFAFATDDRDARFFNKRSEMLPRRHHAIQVILHQGEIRFRKRYLRRPATRIRDRIWIALKLHFYVESAALLRLAGLPGVPTIRKIDPRQGTIEMEYVWGEDIRHSFASGQYPIAYDEIQRKFATLVRTPGEGVANEVPALIRRIVNYGVIPRDVHAANFIRGQRSGTLYMVDYDLAYLRPVPGWHVHLANLGEWLNYRSTP